MYPACFTRSLRSFARRILVPFLAAGLAWSAWAADAAKTSFDLPADPAEKALKLFSQQSGLEVIFASDAAEGIRTNGVKGTMTARQALDQMLANTELVVIQDPKSGAFTVKRAPDPNAPRVAQARGGDHPDENRIPEPGLVAGNAVRRSATGNSDETVVLNPFIISTSREEGYESSDTLAGTRMDTAAKFVGSAITEINQRMMQDLALNNVNDVIDFSTNAVAYDNGRTGSVSDTSQNAALTTSAHFTVRGSMISSTSRDFMSTRIADDSYNVDRISVDRGPNSILFGIGSPQGIINTVSKWAEMKNYYQFASRVDNWGSHRETFKLNQQVIPGKLAIFLAGLDEDAQSDMRPSDRKSDRLYGAITVDPFKDTKIRASVEHGRMDNVVARPWPVQDGLSSWVAAGSHELPPELQNGGALFAQYNTLTSAQSAQKTALASELTSLGFQTGYRGTFPLPDAVFNSSGGGTMPWLDNLGMAVTRYNAGVGAAHVQNSTLLNSPIPYTTNVSGYAQQQEISFTNYTVIVDQTIEHLPLGSLFIEGTFNHQNTWYTVDNAGTVLQNWLLIDKNPTLLTVDGAIIPNPNYDRYLTIAGQPAVSHYYYNDYNAVIQGAYKLSLEDRIPGWLGEVLGHHNFMGLRQRYSTDFIFDSEALTNVSPAGIYGKLPQMASSALTTVNSADNSPITILTYLDPKNRSTWYLPDFYTKFGPYTKVFAGSPLPAADPSGVTPAWVVSNSTRTFQIVDSQAFVIQDFFWKDRIVPTFGWRKDVADNRSFANATASYDGMTGWSLNAANTDPYHGDAAHAPSFFEQIGYTRTAGVVAYPLPWLGVFFNQSNNYNSITGTTNVDEFGSPLPPSSAMGRDWGIRFPLLKGKIYLNIDRYTSKQVDVINQYFKNGFGGSFSGAGVLFAISRELYLDTNDPKFQNYPWISSQSQSWAGTGDDWEKGYEISLTANPVPNWRVSLNLAKQYSAASNYGGVEQRWYDFASTYVKTNYPQFLNVSNGSGARNVPETLADDFQDYQTVLSQMDSLAGRADARQPQYTGTLLTAYDFSHGALKGTGIGGSVRYRGRVADGYAFLPGSTTLYDANKPFYISGRSQLGLFVYRNFLLPDRIRMRLQLNADGINLNEHLYPYLQTDDGTGHPVTVIYAVGQGTTWAFSATFDF